MPRRPTTAENTQADIFLPSPDWQSIEQINGEGALFFAEGARNASNPKEDALRKKFYAMETTMVFVDDFGTIVLAYNDQQGLSQLLDPDTVEQIPVRELACYYKGGKVVECMTVDNSFSFAGVSISDNGGLTWQKIGPLRSTPIDSSSGSSQPINAKNAFALQGDPFLATNGHRTLLVNMANTFIDNNPTDCPDLPNAPDCHITCPGQGPNAVAAFRSEDGGRTWSPPSVIFDGDDWPVLLDGQAPFPDQPSVAMYGNVGVCAFDNAATSQIWLVSTDDTARGGVWPIVQRLDSAQLPDLAIPGASGGFIKDSEVGINRVLVRLIDENNAFLAWQETNADGGNNAVWTMPRVIRLRRNSVLSEWQLTNPYTVDGSIPHTASSIPGGGPFLRALSVPGAAPGGMPRLWKDQSGLDLDIDVVNQELHLVYVGNAETCGNALGQHCPSQVFYRHGTYTNNSELWDPPAAVTKVIEGGHAQRQPTVKVHPWGAVAITWYETWVELIGTGGTAQMRGIIFTQQPKQPWLKLAYTDASPLSVPFSPCPSHGIDPKPNHHVYGDYMSTIALPLDSVWWNPGFWDPLTNDISTYTWDGGFGRRDVIAFVTAHPFSASCKAGGPDDPTRPCYDRTRIPPPDEGGIGNLTTDTHVVSARWGFIQ